VGNVRSTVLSTPPETGWRGEAVSQSFGGNRPQAAPLPQEIFPLISIDLLLVVRPEQTAVWVFYYSNYVKV
jgi:hypothetical protein